MLEKTPEVDNEARISKEVEMKRKFNRNQKRITLLSCFETFTCCGYDMSSQVSFSTSSILSQGFAKYLLKCFGKAI